MYFAILTARYSYYKLIHASIIFECLFSGNTTTEINHQIAERIAIYLADTMETRKTIYRDIKKLYDIRSKYIHGQKMVNSYNTLEKLKPYSTKADNYSRLILNKVITEDSTVFLDNDENLNDWFVSRLFADRTIHDTDSSQSDGLETVPGDQS